MLVTFPGPMVKIRRMLKPREVPCLALVMQSINFPPHRENNRLSLVTLLIVSLILVEHSLDVGSKLRQRVDDHAHPRLCDHALIAFSQHAWVIRLPRGDGHPSPKRCRIRNNLRPYPLVVCAAVGDEVPDYSVANSR